MISLFKSKPKGYLGIDIGSTYIKVLGMSLHGKKTQVDAFAVVHLSEGAVIDNNVQNVPVVAEAIEQAFRISGARIKSTVTSVPASVVIEKVLNFSNAFTEDELEDQIKLEADQFIPYPLDEVALDFQIKGESADSPDLNEVLLVACRQDSVQSREDAITGSGLSCEVIDVDTYALERVSTLFLPENNQEGKVVGVVDLGASSMTLYVLDAGEVIYSREQAFGGNDLTHNLSQASDLPADEIEHLKKQRALPAELVEDFVEPFKHAAAQQVARSLQFYYSSGSHGEIERLFLMGGGAEIEGLASAVSEVLNIETAIADPFRNMTFHSKINRELFDQESPSLVVACGLAMRSFME